MGSWSWRGGWGVLELVWGMGCPGAGVGNEVSLSWCGEWGVLEVVWGMGCPGAGVGNVVSWS